MDKLYVVIGSIYSGPTYCIEHSNIDPKDIGDIIEKDREAVFLSYEQNPENADVPAHELYKSITVDEVSTLSPTAQWSVYIKD